MTAKLIVSLSLVVAISVAATWLFKGLELAQPVAVKQTKAAPIERVDNLDILGLAQPSEKSDQFIDEFIDELKNSERNRAAEEPSSRKSLSRNQAIDNLQGKFRLLETQYGLLSVDDIQELESSLSDIEDVDSLVDLGDALDELLVQ